MEAENLPDYIIDAYRKARLRKIAYCLYPNEDDQLARLLLSRELNNLKLQEIVMSIFGDQ